ncbi:hypothetical protein ACLKA7_005616 [Drosophila subpalustris]
MHRDTAAPAPPSAGKEVRYGPLSVKAKFRCQAHVVAWCAKPKYSPLAREDEVTRFFMRKALVKGVALCLAVHVANSRFDHGKNS